MRLWTSHKGRTKSPCTITVASKLGLFIAFKLQKEPDMFFRSSFDATKYSATFF